MLWNFLTIILFRPIKGLALISMAFRYTMMINQFSDTIQFAGNGLATDSHCYVYDRGWTTCLLYGGPFLFYIPVFKMTRTCRVGAAEIIFYFVLPFHSFCIPQIFLIAFLLKYFLHSENILYLVLCLLDLSSYAILSNSQHIECRIHLVGNSKYITVAKVKPGIT